MKIIILFLLCISLFSCSSNLPEMVTNQNYDQIIQWRERQELDWKRDWQLDTCYQELIDHYLEGIILEWSSSEDNFDFKRSESFNLDGSYYFISESKFLNDTIKSYTNFRFRNDRKLYYKKIQIILDPELPSARYFLLYLYESGKHISTYRSNSYHVDLSWKNFDYEMDKFPKDLKLIFGKDVLIEKNK